MTKKDYEKFAELARKTFPNYAGRVVAVNAIADLFEADNPRFDRERFIKACQPET